MAEPRRAYAKLRFEFDLPDSAKRSEHVEFLEAEIAKRLPHFWSRLTITRVAEGEVDDA